MLGCAEPSEPSELFQRRDLHPGELQTQLRAIERTQRRMP